MNISFRLHAQRALIFVVCCFGLCTSCSRMKFVPAGGNIQTGVASWYGPDFHGKLTSNKEIYNMYEMTAAHKTLPFGTRVMVTNLNNGRWAVVRINDRGPFVGDRVIDLSYAAASLLEMVGSGTAPVRIEVLKNQSPEVTAPKFSVQVGAFINKDHARELRSRLQRKYKDVYLSQFVTENQVYYRVRIRAKDRDAVQRIAQKLWEDGYKVLILEEE